MDVAVKGDGRGSVTEDLGQGFDFKAHLHGPRCKGMPERVAMHTFQSAVAGIFLQFVLQGARLHICLRAGQNVSGRAFRIHFPAKRSRIIRHGNGSDGGVAFGCADHDSCPGAFGSIRVPQPVQRRVNADGLFFHGNAAPLQGAQLADAHTGEQRQQKAKLADVHVHQKNRK